MILEHVFIATQEEEEVMSAAIGFLSSFGFSITSSRGRKLQAKRGTEKPVHHANVATQPQQVSLKFDRGRVEIAISINLPKKHPIAHDLLYELSMGLEQAIKTQEVSESGKMLEKTEDECLIEYTTRRRKRRNRFIVIFTLMGLAFGLMIYNIIVNT